ncbi:trypsin, alkaline B isoform X2 [Pieris rapae]|uniref:trypsin, alkaline B isoform X2 n=1 Tax=Pieris rapae TaxID=64459 RepID=UPI001E27D534|nr:trypsin, alkaline B isoform X2 [Pieris rapae]
MKVAVLALLVAVCAGAPQQRVIGGTQVDISSYPYVAALLRYNSEVGAYSQTCVGSIINNRSILTSINCVENDPVNYWRARIGSSRASSGGIVYYMSAFLFNPSYDIFTSDGDVAILRTSQTIQYGGRVALAGRNYVVRDNTPVTLLGWGDIRYEGPRSENLLKADLIMINQEKCRENYNLIAMTVTENMQCAGTAEGGADFCEGDVGAPLIHNNVLIGIASFRTPVCGRANYPGIYTRVNRYLSWIQSNV